MRLLRLSTVVANTALTRGLARLARRGPLDDQPFVRAITKLVARSDYPAFAKWQAEADPLARRVLGDGAVSVAQFTRPTKDGETMRHDVVVAYRDRATFDAWMANEEKDEWLKRGEALNERVGLRAATIDDFTAPATPAAAAMPPFHKNFATILGAIFPTVMVVSKVVVPTLFHFAPALHHVPPVAFTFGTCALTTAAMLKLSVPVSKKVLGRYLKPGGDTPAATLAVLAAFASLVAGACVATGDVDARAVAAALAKALASKSS
mmetsp:Transcript_20432/g.64285  ORF Transcript_20432/g.64285 Transcript_20432/m.64285 type:complete len:264 (+) Transcript_20432:1142-1933(+)